MGVVYRGVHPLIGKDVAIKVLAPSMSQNPTIVARFVQEARAVNKIQHPRIIDVFAVGETPEVGHYCVMQLLRGSNLRERLAASGPLPIEDMLTIVGQIAEGLDAAHRAWAASFCFAART